MTILNIVMVVIIFMKLKLIMKMRETDPIKNSDSRYLYGGERV